MNPEFPPDIRLEEILQLAPDNAVYERARLLLSKKKWPILERCGTLIWGECRSSGTLRYKVAIDAAGRIFYSNSPAMLKPDKYLLALLLKWYDEPEVFRQVSEVPDWVTEGLRRANSSVPMPVKGSTDTTSQSREKRMNAMQEGAQELRRWLLDVARQGLAGLQMQDTLAWEAIASRLTDYKLAGPARRVRAMKDASGHPQWPEIFAENIAAMVLWTEAFSRFEELSPELKEELLVQGGQNARKEDALQSQPVADRWFVLYTALQQEAQLNIRKTWLWGEDCGTPALLLDYAWGGEHFAQEWKLGEVFSGKIHYYPGAFPLRALAGEGISAEERGFPLRGRCTSAREMARQFAEIAGVSPWISVFPFLLSPVTCSIYKGMPCLLDQEGNLILLDTSIPEGLSLIGLGSGGSVVVFGLWNGKQFKPLGAQNEETAVFLYFSGAY